MHAWYLTKRDLCVKLVMAIMTFTHLEVQLKMATTDLEFDKRIPGRSACPPPPKQQTVSTWISIFYGFLKGPRAKSPLAPPALIKSVHRAAWRYI